MNIQSDIDLLLKLNSVDIDALEDAKATLEAIKDADPGTYDEMIDESIRLIRAALNISCIGAIERIAEQLGAKA